MSAVEEKATKTRGRPRRDPVETLRTQVWYLKLVEISKLGPRGLERAFKGAPSSSLISKYKAGTVSPGNSVVGQADKLFKGSGRSFNHPLWRLLGGDLLTLAEQKASFLALGPNAKKYFVRSDETYNLFWRTPKISGQPYIDAFHLKCSEDALASFLLLLEESIIRQSLSDFDQGRQLWPQMKNQVIKKALFDVSPENQKTIFLAVGTLLTERWSRILGANDVIDWRFSAPT